MNHPSSTPISNSRSLAEMVRHPLTTSKLLFFAAAGISFALSVWLWFSGDRERGLFVGLWVPSILSAGGLLLSGGRNE